MKPLLRLLLPVLAMLAGAGPLPARAEIEVDVALVVAVDVSFSMDPEEQALQRDGFAEAFRSDIVQNAITRGNLGRIAVVYMEWAGASDQKVVVPWTVLDNARSATNFADQLALQPTRRAARTSISGAIDFAVGLLAASGVSPMRQVIDVSGDGPNNQGRAVTAARDDALAKGITINGLPIMLKAPSYFDVADLDLYYRDCVIGGVGAFMVPARSRDQFRDAIKTKIIMEVADAPPVESLIQRAQTQRAPNCFVGESQWRDRMGN